MKRAVQKEGQKEEGEGGMEEEEGEEEEEAADPVGECLLPPIPHVPQDTSSPFTHPSE